MKVIGHRKSSSQFIQYMEPRAKSSFLILYWGWCGTIPRKWEGKEGKRGRDGVRTSMRRHITEMTAYHQVQQIMWHQRSLCWRPCALLRTVQGRNENKEIRFFFLVTPIFTGQSFVPEGVTSPALWVQEYLDASRSPEKPQDRMWVTGPMWRCQLKYYLERVIIKQIFAWHLG